MAPAIAWLLLSGCDPCPRAAQAEMVDLFEHLDQHRCLHRRDRKTLQQRMETYHTQTTLHCEVSARLASLPSPELQKAIDNVPRGEGYSKFQRQVRTALRAIGLSWRERNAVTRTHTSLDDVFVRTCVTQ